MKKQNKLRSRRNEEEEIKNKQLKRKKFKIRKKKKFRQRNYSLKIASQFIITDNVL